MANFSRINCSDIKLGMKFPSPVFFDDGENMFVAENKTIKAYHIAALVLQLRAIILYPADKRYAEALSSPALPTIFVEGFC